MKMIVLFSLMSIWVFGAFEAKIKPINKYTKQRMIEGNSWRKGCPVPIKDLRYIRVTHRNFYRSESIGEIIVHKDVAKELTQIFEELYSIGYPIKKMKLVSDYQGSDWRSIESDNTSAFNCRSATGSSQWSKHSYGKAIDINPIENPYVFKSGRSSHNASLKYIKRKANHPAVVLQKSKILKIFKKYGWKWGGDWTGAKDYQHFYK